MIIEQLIKCYLYPLKLIWGHLKTSWKVRSMLLAQGVFNSLLITKNYIAVRQAIMFLSLFTLYSGCSNDTYLIQKERTDQTSGQILIDVSLFTDQVSLDIFIKQKAELIAKLKIDKNNPCSQTIDIPPGTYDVEIVSQWKGAENKSIVEGVQIYSNRVSLLSTLEASYLYKIVNYKEKWIPRFLNKGQENLKGDIKIIFPFLIEQLDSRLSTKCEVIDVAAQQLNDSTILYENLKTGFYTYHCTSGDNSCPFVYGIYVSPGDASEVRLTGFGSISFRIHPPGNMRWEQKTAK